jgi:hypothetical protein
VSDSDQQSFKEQARGAYPHCDFNLSGSLQKMLYDRLAILRVNSKYTNRQGDTKEI